ncbi:MAG: hypothetical protein HZB42_08715 [Sphingobacteriales bacterium]|nr:hypothetical protein [Sphingobacteriales bacterium]
MLLNIVTDEELLTSQIVKTILLILTGAGIIYNLFRIVRKKSKSKRIINSVIFIILSVAIIFIFKEYRVESALLKNPEYVQGTTIGYCNVFARGQGIEFEYEVNGQKFRNCNTYHPVSKDSIIVPGGKYEVRYSQKFSGKGRMNFRKKTE